MNKAVLAVLRCPISGQALTFHDSHTPYLQTVDGQYQYPIEHGIAMLVTTVVQQKNHLSEPLLQPQTDV